MIATIEYIESKFKEYNELMFEGKLQLPPFKLSKARTYLGQVRFQRRRNLDGTMSYMNFKFVISTKMDLPETEVEDTIIHEMIHHWILSNQMQDTGPHGKLFKCKMRDINQKYGRNLSVVHKATKEEKDRDKEIRQHLICISRLRDGRMGVTVVAKSRIFQLWREMSAFPNIKEQKWVVSQDPFFNRFPRSITAKIYPVPLDELVEHLKDAHELVRKGKTLFYATLFNKDNI